MKDATLINVILDRSGSMQSIARETVGAFNNFLKEQKELPDYAELSLFQFDNLYEQNYIRKPIKKCKDLISGSTYSPRGMTALYDAVGRTITTLGDDLKNMSEEEYNTYIENIRNYLKSDQAKVFSIDHYVKTVVKHALSL